TLYCRTVACTTAVIRNPSQVGATGEQTRRCDSGRAGVGRNPVEGRLRLPMTVLRSLQHPGFFVDHTVMWPAEQRQIGERRPATARPPDQMMSVAPAEWPSASGENTM